MSAVDPRAADWILRAVTRDLRARARADGGAPSFPRYVDEALRWLEAEAAGDVMVSESGPIAGNLSNVTSMKPAREAAEMVGCSERHARRLADDNRVRSFRAGPRALLIDVEGLRRVLGRAG